jgi:4-amino-4-deoxychorismate lyase
VDGMISNLIWHQARFDKTRRELYGDTSRLTLGEHLPLLLRGTYRVRVEYTHEILNVDVFPITPRLFETLCCVETDIEYGYKYANRSALNELIPKSVDDVIFTCNGELRDTSIANIALFIEGQWLTPLTPLLEGTTRARLLASGMLKTAILTTQSLQKAQKFAIMNALLGFHILKNPCFKGI